MRIRSFGCSHIYGSELDDINVEHVVPGSELTWPALIAQRFQLKYHTHAWPGRGNLFIAEQVLNHLHVPALFIINWTYIDRFDFKDATNDTPQHSFGSNWSTCRPGENDQHSTAYYRYLHSEYADKLTNLMQIKICIDALTQNNRPFIMTCMDDLLFDQRWHVSDGIKYLQQQIRPHVTDFEGKNFVEFAKSHGYSTTDQNHLCAAGHKYCADYIVSKFGIDKIQSIVGVPFEGV